LRNIERNRLIGMQDHADSTAQHSTGSKLRRAVILALEIAIILPSSCYFLFLGPRALVFRFTSIPARRGVRPAR